MKIEWRRNRISRQDRVDSVKRLFKYQEPEAWTDSKGRTWLIYFHLEGLHTTPADTGPVGSFDVLGVTIVSEDGRTLPFSFFREIPLATIWETVRRREAEDAESIKYASDQERLYLQPIAELYIAEARTGRRGRRYDVDHYREVARLYDEAVSRGEHPTRFVADKLHLSRSAAAKQVSVARNDYGLLPRTQQGRSSTADRRTAK